MADLFIEIYLLSYLIWWFKDYHRVISMIMRAC